ncbi:YaaC family protein [Citricoccus sp.]|uniref:YaaC family protein n=1 Tax=Citricoccus sp. TaxID=1978372 RepID=UPI0028BE31FA|nr:hypothetical protein [Citricoccus sp.]
MDVFQAALEQAQQQYKAAAAIGYESRPLNLFYGLSQAGRALAAISPKLRGNHPEGAQKNWESSGHGVGFQLGQLSTPFWDREIEVLPNRRDSFSRASIAVGSTYVDVGRVTLGSLVAQLPESLPLRERLERWDSYMKVNFTSRTDGRLLAFDIGRGVDSISAIQAKIDRYPLLRGWSLYLDREGQPRRPSETSVYLDVPEGSVDATGYVNKLRGASTYAGNQVILPVAGQAESVIEPIMAWWLILFDFSMLARYEPRAWTNALHIGRSEVASQVEFLLDAALIAVPELLAEQLERLTANDESDG